MGYPVPRIYSSSLKSLTILKPSIIVQSIMGTIILLIFVLIFMNKDLLLENLALRQQLVIMKQHVKRPKIRIRDPICA